MSENERHEPAGRVVVVGTDGDLESDAALRFAAAEARSRSAELVVMITYWKPIDPDLQDIETPDGELKARARRRAELAVARAFSAEQSLPSYRIVSEEGDAWRKLLSCYENAALIVVGTHRRHLLSRMLHAPSTGGQLRRRAQVPVAVVPPDAS